MNTNPTGEQQVRIPLKWVAAVGVLVLLVLGARVFWAYYNDPPRPWVLKWQIRRYLKSESGYGNFKTDFVFPSKAEMARNPEAGSSKPAAGAPAVELPKRDFDALKKEYIEQSLAVFALERGVVEKQKQAAGLKGSIAKTEKQLADLAPASSNNAPALLARIAAWSNQIATAEKQVSGQQQSLDSKQQIVAQARNDLILIQRTWAQQLALSEGTDTNRLSLAVRTLTRETRDKLSQAPTYAAIYLGIGQELWVADRLLGSANPEHRRQALTLVREAIRNSVSFAENGGLASLICRAYVLPAIDLPENAADLDRFITDASDLFRQIDDLPGLAQITRLQIARAKTPQRADAARAQLAQAYERAGEYVEAVRWYKQIKLTNDYSWALRRLPRVEQQAKQQR